MCGPLCAALLGREAFEDNAQTPLEWLEQNNLFIVSLDSERRWYRYHHLFRSFLQQRLERRHDAGEIAQLHDLASAWFARQGSLEEALQHALLGHDTPAAVRLMAEHRHALMDSEQWQLHERALRMFPAEMVAAHPDLLLMSAWMARLGLFDSTHALSLVDRADSLVAQMADQPEHAVHLRGEIDTLRTIMAYEAATDPETVVALARRALATTPRAWYYVRSTAWLYMAVAHQMAGELDRAYAVVVEGEPEDVAQNGAVRGTGGGLILLHSVDGGRFADDAAGGGPFSCGGRDIPPYRITGLGALFLGQRRLPARRSGGCRGSRAGCRGNPLLGQTDGLFAEHVHLRVDLPGARPAGPGATEAQSGLRFHQGDPQRRVPAAGAGVPGGVGRDARRSRHGQPLGDDESDPMCRSRRCPTSTRRN